MTENSTAPSNTGPSFTDQLAARNANAVSKGNGTHLQMVDVAGTKAASRMSGGKIAAIVAGVGLVAGATYMMTRPSQEKRSWTARVDEQRANAKGVALGT